mgnify:CR=1 FL=1
MGTGFKDKLMDDKIKGWEIVKTTSEGQEYIQSATLKEGPRSKSIAVFFRNKHKNTDDYIVSLKISHNSKDSRGWLNEKPDKTITLSNEQIDKLADYIQEHYTPLSLGEKSYISLSSDNLSTVLRQVTELGLSDEDMVNKLYESGVLTNNLSVAITAAERKVAIQDFEKNISLDLQESFWQNWFGQQKWVLGSEYIKILTERTIDEHHIADYIMQSVDGFLDLVEIKKPNLRFWTEPDSHGNYRPSAELVAAITQCLNYIYRVERKADSDDFRERVSGVRTVKPKCMLVYGRSDTWGKKQFEAFRILNAAYNQLNIITYDQLLVRAKGLLGLESNSISSDDDDEIPF